MTSNVDMALRWIETAGSGDADGFRATMSDDVVVQTMGTSILSAKRGLDEVTELVRTVKKHTKNGIDFRIVETTAQDDRVAVEYSGKCEMANGERYDNVYHLLFHLRDGKICRVKEYMDTALVDSVLAKGLSG
jgi:ketosteroid isomerase-like protein